MSHEFSFIGGVVVDFSDLSDFAVVLSVFVGSKNAAKWLDARELFCYFVVFLELNERWITIFTLCSCLVVASVNAEGFYEVWTPISSLFARKGLTNSFLLRSVGFFSWKRVSNSYFGLSEVSFCM